MDENYMLSTVDNPYDPFTEWDEWLAYDLFAGHHTCEYLARVSTNSDALSESVQKHNDYLTMKTIVNEDPFGLYIIVSPSTFRNKTMKKA